MAEATNFTVTGGLPFAQVARVVGGKQVWSSLDQFEAQMQIRQGKLPTSQLLYDFSPHLKTAFDGDDIVVSWDLTGAETRKLVGGYYDLVLSDTGPEDARALPPIVFGKIKMAYLTTTPGGS